MEHMITGEDILAFQDVLKLLDEEAAEPGMAVERCGDLIAALDEVRKKVGNVIASLQSRAVRSLEGQPKVVGDTVYSVRVAGQERAQHPVIRARIVNAATHDDDGEPIADGETIAQRAVEFTYALFVADSSKPKEGGLRRLRLSREEALVFEHTKNELKVTKL